MTHNHSIREALELAESLDEDLGNYSVIRELKVQLRALLKDEESGTVFVRTTTRPIRLPGGVL